MAKIANIAHRGVPPLAPENTLEGFDKAVALGADEVEMDVRLSADGEAVVIHDETFRDRPVWEWTASQLKAAGVPGLAEALALLAGRARVQVELKHAPGDGRDLAGKALEEIRRAGAAETARPISFHVPYLDRVRSLEPAIPLGFLVSPKTEGDAAAWADVAKRLAPCLLLAHIDLLSPAVIWALQEKGVWAGAWGLGADAALMQKAASLDLVCACSDRPDQLKPYLA